MFCLVPDWFSFVQCTNLAISQPKMLMRTVQAFWWFLSGRKLSSRWFLMQTSAYCKSTVTNEFFKLLPIASNNVLPSFWQSPYTFMVEVFVFWGYPRIEPSRDVFIWVELVITLIMSPLMTPVKLLRCHIFGLWQGGRTSRLRAFM